MPLMQRHEVVESRKDENFSGRRVDVAAIPPDCREAISDEALLFVADLERQFGGRVESLLVQRHERQARFDAGERPDFLPETRDIREGEWSGPPIPPDLRRRHVEITGPSDNRGMVVNALNAPHVDGFMVDFEDALTPEWGNVAHGQQNIFDAVRRKIDFTDPANGREYKLNDKTATLHVRPRGWHLKEDHMYVDGKPVTAALFDFGVHFFNNAKQLLENGTGPYFYLPKMQSHNEAALWSEIFASSEEALGIEHGSTRATVLIEHVLAAFEMHEIAFALKDYIAALNAGRWDYLFSFGKVLKEDPTFILQDRSALTMAQPFMEAYARAVVDTSHRRGIHAMGGMSAFIPTKDPEANARAFENVASDKMTEVERGFDGTWIAHPGLAETAATIFSDALGGNDNQIKVPRPVFSPSAEALLAAGGGPITEGGLRNNVSVAIRYLESWFSGRGAAAIFNIMEDAATAEIARTQLWKWQKHGAQLSDDTEITKALLDTIIDEEFEKIREERGGSVGKAVLARDLVRDLVTSDKLEEYLTTPAYQILLDLEQQPTL